MPSEKDKVRPKGRIKNPEMVIRDVLPNDQIRNSASLW